MHNHYFGFSESPFENTLDQRFLFPSKDQREALAALLYFAETKKGFAVVCGDSGTGKSMLINSFLDRLPESIQPIIMLNPYVTPFGILIHISKALRIRITRNESVLEITDKVKKALISAKLEGKSFVLIIDEAHMLSNQALEELQLLSNIETSNKKLLQILLVGQLELSHKLGRPEMRHLRQRINIERFLSPLNPEETLQYADHHLRKVGSSLALVLEDKCRSLIFKMTQGSPPRINQLFDRAFLICMHEGLSKINKSVLKRAYEARQTNLIFPPKSSKARTYRVNKPLKPLILSAASVAVLVLLGIFTIRSGFGVDNFQSVLQQVRSAIQTASGPQTPLVAKSEDLKKPENESTRVRQSGKPQGAPALSPEFLTSTPIPSPLPEGSWLTEIISNLSSSGKQSSSPQGESEMKSKVSGNPKVAEISTKKEGLGKPQEAINEVDGPPAPSPMDAPAQFLSASTQLKAQAGDSLNRIVNRNFPDNKKLGLVALILANPEIADENKILPGQTFYLPEISSDKARIRLRDQQFYAIYGRYLTAESLKKDTSWLQQKNVHFVLRDTKNSKGKVVHRVFLGGYSTEAELEKALKSVNLKSAKGHKGIDQADQSAGSVKNQAEAVDVAIADKQEALGNPQVTIMYLKRGEGNDPVIPNKDKPGISPNKFAMVDQAYQAAFHKNHKKLTTSRTKGAFSGGLEPLLALSEVQMKEVHVETSLALYKGDSTFKLDNSYKLDNHFNGFTGLGLGSQPASFVNNQANITALHAVK
jgi:type II secretory pathway predicted ATPase ExeA